MNNVSLIGRLTKDPQIRYTTNNTMVASFFLAVNRSYKTQEEQTANFIPIVAYGKTAEFAKNYFIKGEQIGLTGRINTRNYEDKQKITHYVVEVIANKFFFADSKKTNKENGFVSTNNNNSIFTKEEIKDLPF